MDGEPFGGDEGTESVRSVPAPVWLCRSLYQRADA